MIRRMLPWAIPLAAALLVIWQAQPPKTPLDGMRIHDFGRIPVVDNGRVKPMDQIGRTLLRIVSDREVIVDEEGRRQPAIRWLLDVMVEEQDPANRARRHKVFRIVHPQVLDALGLQEREGFRYSIEEFGDRLPKLGEPIRNAKARQDAEQPLDAYERHLLKLHRHLFGYYLELARLAIPHVVPPSGEMRDWQTLPEAMGRAEGTGKPDVNAQALSRILQAYASGETAKFNEEVAAYLARIGQDRPADRKKAEFEAFFNNVDPFNQCKVLYLIGFALSCLAWLGWGTPLNRSAFRLLWFTFTLHTLALGARIYLSGRPPVTNLYSSAIFIGWGAVLLGLILERIYRLGVGNIISAVAGFATLLIAHILAAEGDTMEVLQAVLDTQFWLATHVTCITTGYATTYVAGLIGILFILRGVFTPSLTPEMRQSMARMIYGTICFATFFSFVGTVLGGLWADDSWGRFWGWDPKENGALMIVLWNALTLHARWGGLVRDRGLAVLSLFGNIVVSWSWFGVNELGKGLHAYGFTEGRSFWLAMFVLSQLAIMGLGLLPPRFWRSPEPVRGAHAETP